MFKEVYIIKSVVEYLAENLYQADKIFVDWFELYPNFAALLIKREVKGKCKYKRARKKKKAKKSEVLASFVSSILRYMSCLNSCWEYV
jgi:hypothetical protein